MACDEAFYRHYHKKQAHRHDHRHDEHHAHPHPPKEKVSQGDDAHAHQHDELLHRHPYEHDDPHHHPDQIQVGPSVYILENRQEKLVLEDVELLELEDDQILVRNVLGQERQLTTRLRRIHFVHRDKILMLLEKS